MRKLSTTLMLCLLLSGFYCENSYGQIVPYRLFGIGKADPVGGDAGLGSFFGPAVERTIGPLRYFAQAVTIDLIFDGDELIGFEYTAIDTQTAWDGSEVYLFGEGSAMLIPRPDIGPTYYNAIWDGDWTILGGSGRFENASSEDGAIDLFVFFFPFDLTDNETLRPFFYTKNGEWDLGNN